jgi:hypothetical protein
MCLLLLLMYLLLQVTPLRRAMLPPLAPAIAHAGVVDAAALVPDASHDPGRYPDTFGSTDTSANVRPPADRLHCNSVLADTSARTVVHTPSKDKAAADYPSAVLPAPRGALFGLDVHSTVHENDMGPREPVSPRDQVSE